MGTLENFREGVGKFREGFDRTPGEEADLARLKELKHLWAIKYGHWPENVWPEGVRISSEIFACRKRLRPMLKRLFDGFKAMQS